MKQFIVYNKQGKILRTGICQDIDFALQANQDERVIEGEANDATQKIVGGKIKDKTPKEISRDNLRQSRQISFEKQPAFIINRQWQDILDRIKKLEKINNV